MDRRGVTKFVPLDGHTYTASDVAQIIWERDEAIKKLDEVGLKFGDRTDRVRDAISKAKPKRVKYWKNRKGECFAHCPCSKDVTIPIDVSCYCSRCGQKLLGVIDREQQLDMWR